MATIAEQFATPPEIVVPTSVATPSTPLSPPAAPPNPYAGFEKVDSYAGFETAESPYAGFSKADDLDKFSVDELTADRDKFNPKDYFAANPDVARDPAKLRDLLEVYRRRQKEGLSAGGVAKAAVTEALPTVGKVLGGVRDLAAGVLDIGMQPAANVLGSVFTGDIFNPQMRSELAAETHKGQKKALVEMAAGAETSSTGLADLARMGLRKFASRESNLGLQGTGLTKEQVTGTPTPEKTDQELLRQLSADVEFGKQLEEVGRGRGEALSSLGLDADTLAKEGIILDPENIERLSLVDPLTLIATGGVFSGVTAVGKTVFTAASRAAAESMISKLGQLAARAATAPIRAAGSTAELTGAAIREAAPVVKAVGAIAGLIQGGPIGGLVGERAGALARTLAPAIEKSGAAVKNLGTALGNSATFQKAIIGGAEGVAAGAPIAVLSDEDKTAGALLGAGGALGASIGGAIGAKQSIANLVSKSKLAPADIVYPPTESKPYGHNENLDFAHDAAIKTLPQQSQNAINSFRETVRDLGGEVYVLDPEFFQQSLLENAERAKGAPLTAAEWSSVKELAASQGYFDTTLPGTKGETRRAVFLNNSASPLTHETGHLFHSLLSPERQADLIQTAREVYSPKQIAQFKAEYESRFGRSVSEDYLLNEVVAENFSQLFRNTPISELTTPPRLLQKIGRQITDAAESLGLDLTAGVLTPDALPSSLRFNDVVRDAAREVLSPQRPAPVVEPAPRSTPIKPEPISLTEAGRQFREMPEVTPARPVVEAIPTVASESSPAAVAKTETPRGAQPADEARAIAEAAPDTALPGANMSQREILGEIALRIADGEAVKYEYREAPEASGAALEADRVTRRAEIDAARNMPEDLRHLVGKTGFPFRIGKTKNGVIQILDYTPDMLASNAYRWAKSLSELAVKDPNNVALKRVTDEFGLDVQAGEWTEQGWRALLARAEEFSANHRNGFTGSGRKIAVPEDVREAGISAPAEKGAAIPMDQTTADFINLLYNLRVPDTSRFVAGSMPGNIVSQRISAATVPGRVGIPALVEPKKPGGKTKLREPFKAPYEGEQVREVNPLRGELETALQAAKISIPKGIEVVRVLNLEHIAHVVAEPNLPRTAGGNSPILRAGFEPKALGTSEREWLVAGQLRGQKQQITVQATDMAAARKQGEARGMRVSKIEASDKFTNAMFLPRPTEEIKARMADADPSVKDPNGNPKVFYHGSFRMADLIASGRWRLEKTNARSLFGPGFYFTESSEVAGGPVLRNKFRKFFGKEPLGYAMSETLTPHDFFMGKRISEENPNPASPGVFPAFLDIKNPLIIDRFYSKKEISGFLNKIDQDTWNLLNTKGRVEEALKKSYRRSESGRISGKEIYDAIEAGTQGLHDDPYYRTLDEETQHPEPKKIPEVLQKMGFDGINYPGGVTRRDFPRHSVIVAWKPEQVISAFAGEGNKNPASGQFQPAEVAGRVEKFSPEEPIAFSTASFQAATAKGKVLEEQGFEFRRVGGLANPGIEIFNSGDQVGEIVAVRKSPKEADVALINISKPYQGQGISEILYRELGQRLKEEGVSDLTGMIINERALKSRSKVFPETEIESVSEFGPTERSYEVRSRIPETAQFAAQKRVPKKEEFFKTDELIRPSKENLPSYEDFKTQSPGLASAWVLRDGRSHEGSGGRYHDSEVEGFSGLAPTDRPAEQFQNATGAMRVSTSASSRSLYDYGGDLGVSISREPSGAQAKYLKDLLDQKSAKYGARFEDESPIFDKVAIDIMNASGEVVAGKIFDLPQDRGAAMRFFRNPFESSLAPETSRIASVGDALKKAEGDAQFAPKKKTDEYELLPPKSGFSKAWILPNGTPVQLGGTWHHQWLAEHPELATKYGLDIPKFEGSDAEGVREAALKAGFGRINYSQNSGTLTVEARAKDWRKMKSSVERMVESNLDSIDNMSVTLLDEAASKVVDSQNVKLFNYDDAEKLQHLPFITEGEVRGQFQAAEESQGELLNVPKNFSRRQTLLRREIARQKVQYPEAVPLQYRTNENGDTRFDANGEPTEVGISYGLYETPLAKQAAKGVRGDDAREAAIVDAYASKIKSAYREAKKNPAIAAGANWYSLAREKLQKVFGDDTKFFTELLGATSAQTDVPTNYRYSIDAYNNFKAGEYDNQIQKYREGKEIWDSGDHSLEPGEKSLADRLAEAGLPADATRAAWMGWWTNKHDLKPRQSNGKLFGANSDAVLKVLDGSWRETVQGPKTPNFAGNLSGDSFEATIDVWAARLMHRLGNEGNPKRWRILPKNEVGVTDADFFLGQKAFRKAGDAVGVSPDSLQAIMWFAEKDHYDKKGWTGKAGKEKSDFNVLLDRTTRAGEGGKLRILPEDLDKPTSTNLKPQGELQFSPPTIEPRAGAKKPGTVFVPMTQSEAEQIADAINNAEGGSRTKKRYGKLTGPILDFTEQYPTSLKGIAAAELKATEARALAVSAIKKTHKEWQNAGKPEDFIKFLARKYAPSDARASTDWFNSVWRGVNKAGVEPPTDVEFAPIPAAEAGRIADAIYHAEGGANAKKPYGILSVKVANEAEARKVALNTIQNNYKRWHDAGLPGEFLEFLAKRYAPANVANDPNALNKNWLKNVRAILDKSKR